ncbi:MAG: FGGY-family carbohydrate kinase [Bacteroidales bacterium]|nr:FGGY-family carbohydrate kinase [Bacteroidales bacterium]MBN2756771.1 FGGY-family carbohydrate kinase [Bacteroidales bacterium]
MKFSDELILSIDAGTQSIRAVFIDLNGNIIEIVKTPIEPYFSEFAGWAEQEPDYYWQKLTETTKALFNQTKIDTKRIKAVTLTTQRGTVINLDKNGNALRPAITWLDQRRAEETGFPSKFMKLGLKALGLNESILHAVKNGECNWIKQNQSDIWEKTHKYVYLSGFFTFKLTGEYVDSIGNMVGYMPFDYKNHKWTNSKHINYKMFPVEREKLVELVKPSEQLAVISEKASIETGIPKGLPLMAAGSDKSSEVLGSGVFSPETACLSYGTTATIQTSSKKYLEVIPFFPPYPSSIPEYYNTEVMIFRGFWMINWFKKEFGYREVEIAKKTGKLPEDLFDEMISKIPPGSMGLTLQPYWSPGTKVPGLEAKGAIIGFGDVHTRAHIYRAILEGLAYALKEGMIKTEKNTKVKIDKIRVSGGGSQSKNAMQLTADIFNKPAEKPHTYETSALGAAINAAVGMNFYNNYEEAVKNMCRISETYQPIKANVEIYEKLYSDVYSKMYKRLQPLYNQIRSIVKYPEKF